jgi:hypothetical protein
MSTSIDYNSFKPVEKEKKKAQAKASTHGVRWWLAEDALLPGAILSQVGAIVKADRGRIDAYNTYGKLYGTWTPTFWNGYQLANSGKPTSPVRDRLTYNIVQSCIDTLTARISQNKPKPMFLTTAGDSKLQRKAKKLDSFCYGLFYENNIYQAAPKAFRDACIFGEGILHCYQESGSVKFERVLPYELLVDYLESHYGPESTKSLFRIKNIDRTELAEAFPDKAEDIARMSNTSVFISSNNRSVADTVTVVEAWRLPTGGKPGKHVIVTENTVLHSEDYEEDFFPFAILRYSPRIYGFYAQGMAEQLVPLQIEINRTLISIQRSLYLGGTHKIFVKAGSKVIKSHFDNAVGTIMEYAGDTMPQYIVPQLVQPEIYNHLENMIQKGYQLPGVSQLSASSLKPMGIDSGKALRAVDDIQIQRFQTVAQAYEQFFVDLAKIAISVARKAYDESGELTVKVPGKRFIEKIDWSDVDMENDEFQLQIYPVSKLPNDPEGRLATIQEMMQAGLITPEAGRRLLDYPDLEAEENLYNAASDYIHMILDKIVEDGEYTAPSPDDNLQLAKKLVLEYIAQGKLNNLKDDRLELLRKFNKQIDYWVNGGPAGEKMRAEQAMIQSQMAAQGIVPQGNPQTPPTSPLIQNVPGVTQ